MVQLQRSPDLSDNHRRGPQQRGVPPLLPQADVGIPLNRKCREQPQPVPHQQHKEALSLYSKVDIMLSKFYQCPRPNLIKVFGAYLQLHVVFRHLHTLMNVF